MKSEVDFWFSDEKGKFRLVVNPESIEISSSSNVEVNEVVNLGQVTTATIPELATFSIESFWLDDTTSYLSNDENTSLTKEDFVSRIDQTRKNKKPIRIIVSELDINIEVLIDSFSYSFSGGDKDLYYKLSFVEYKKAQAKFIKQEKKAPKKPARPKKKKGFSIGDTVIVNGRLHRDSYGSGPGQTEKNATRKINFMAKGRKCPIHVTTLDGGWRGWVTEGSVRHK